MPAGAISIMPSIAWNAWQGGAQATNIRSVCFPPKPSGLKMKPTIR